MRTIIISETYTRSGNSVMLNSVVLNNNGYKINDTEGSGFFYLNPAS